MRRLVQIYFLSQTDNYKGLQKKGKKKKIKVGNVSFLFFYSTCFTSIVYFLCWICLFITDDYEGNCFPRDCTFLAALYGKFRWECFRLIGGLTTVRWNWFLHLPQPLPPFLLNQKDQNFQNLPLIHSSCAPYSCLHRSFFAQRYVFLSFLFSFHSSYLLLQLLFDLPYLFLLLFWPLTVFF